MELINRICGDEKKRNSSRYIAVRNGSVWIIHIGMHKYSQSRRWKLCQNQIT